MQDSQIQVSVVSIAYNHEKYIRQCLDSLLMQKTNFAFEIIIHDDASTDCTADIIREYEAKYPDIIKPIYQSQNQHSQGVDTWSNFIYPRARGRYVAYCEGDDFWTDPYKLQKQFDALEAHPQCCFSMHKVASVNEDGSENEKVFEPLNQMDYEGILSQEELAKTIWNTSFVFQLTCRFIRTECIKPSCPELHAEFNKYENGDRNQIRRLLLKGPCYYFPEPMSCYRCFSQNSWTSRLKEKSVEEKNKLYIKNIKSELLFDEFSGHQYNELILDYIWKTRFLPCFKGTPIVTYEAMVEYGLSLEDVLPKALRDKARRIDNPHKNATVLWGAGDIARRTWKVHEELYGADNPLNIVAVVDNNSQLWGQDSYVKGVKIISPERLKQIDFDRIAILNSYQEEVANQLIEMFGNEDERIKHVFDHNLFQWLMAAVYLTWINERKE